MTVKHPPHTIETRPAIEPVARPKTTADVLRHAALIIEERGWTQFFFEKEGSGEVCAIGALGLATRSQWGGKPAAFFRHYLIDNLGAGGTMTWNDAPGRTADEVTAALRAAADEADR